MAQLYSQKLELRCLITLTSSKVPEPVRSTLIGQLTDDHFNYPPVKAAFSRVSRLAKKRFQLIDFEDLIEDPQLDLDFRDILKSNADLKPCRSRSKIKTMVLLLDNYRKTRLLWYAAQSVMENIQSDSFDIEENLNILSTKLALARNDINDDAQITTVGVGGNADTLTDSILNDETVDLIPTGYAAYDTVNGGFPTEGVVLLAATTSGGKSTVLMNLLKNIHVNTYANVLRVSFEMGDKQEHSRFLSLISEVPFYKIKQKKLTPQDKKTIKTAYKKFNEFGEKHDCWFKTITPTRGMTIEDTLRLVKPFGPKIIGIDYVSLLEGVDSENQWRIMSSIVRVCKIFTRETKCLIILLAQLDDDSSKLRYSRGMREHVDVFWFWNYSDLKVRETKILPLTCGKARDGSVFSFELGDRFERMCVIDVEHEDDYSKTPEEDDNGNTKYAVS